MHNLCLVIPGSGLLVSFKSAKVPDVGGDPFSLSRSNSDRRLGGTTINENIVFNKRNESNKSKNNCFSLLSYK